MKIINKTIQTLTGEKIMGMIPQTAELTFSEFSKLASEGKLASELKCSPAYELSLVRVFFHGEKWHIATQKKINAFKSFWANRTSFGSYFEIEVGGLGYWSLDEFYNLLDKNVGYFFLFPLRDENRVLVSKNLLGNVLYLVAVEENGVIITENIEKTYSFNLKIPIKKELPWSFISLTKVNSFEEISNYYNKALKEDCDSDSVGIMVYSERGYYRILFPEYETKRELRQNVSDIIERYVKIPSELVDDFKSQYNDFIFDFDEKFQKLVNELHSIYLKRHIGREIVKTTPLKHLVLVKLHQLYRETKNPIRKQDIISILISEYSSILSRLIKPLTNPNGE